MPPKAKFTKEQITKAALGVVSEKGVHALTAKELGAALGTSTTPIFTVFNSMQEVQDAVMLAAMEQFEEYAHKAAHIKPVFKQVGLQMILFAKEEPKLYQLIYMSSISEAQTFDDIYARLGSVADECLNVLQKDYDLSRDSAKTLFEHVWIHTFGIGALCATGMCDFSHEQIARMLTQDFNAMMMLMKSGKSD
jgi:AcrR family transcriptional regulator